MRCSRAVGGPPPRGPGRTSSAWSGTTRAPYPDRRRHRSLPLAAGGLLLAALLVAPPAAAQNPHFDSLFWQPDLSNGFSDPAFIKAQVERAARAGTRTIVLQWLGRGRDDVLDHPADPVRVLLDEAAARGLTVWLGTWENPAIWTTRQPNLIAWKRAMVVGTALAARAAERYAAHPAFAGWYWTPEAVWWDPPEPDLLERLTSTTAEAVQHLKLLGGHPVAIALGPGGRGEANLLSLSWCRYLEGSGADVVVVMDGVGSAHLDLMLVPALYDVMFRCAERADATLWADMELFGPDGAAPNLRRLEAQYAAAREGASQVIGFDLSHHLAPGTVGERFWRGEHPRADPLPVQLVGDPALPWTDRTRFPRVDAVLPRSRRVDRVELVLRGTQPHGVLLNGLNGGVHELGELSAQHGPGRDEWTWVWQTDGAAAFVSGLRLRLKARKQVPTVVEVRVFAAP